MRTRPVVGQSDDVSLPGISRGASLATLQYSLFRSTDTALFLAETGIVNSKKSSQGAARTYSRSDVILTIQLRDWVTVIA
jgi:hypothetical protein